MVIVFDSRLKELILSIEIVMDLYKNYFYIYLIFILWTQIDYQTK